MAAHDVDQVRIAAADRRRPATVLVVEDEPREREVIQHFLAAEGFHVLVAEDGDSALQAVPAHRPDLVLLDVRLPGTDGYEICRRLKDDPQTAFVPVIILTALRGVKERIRGASAGADEFLSKPFDHVELTMRVKALVRAKRYNDQIVAYNAELERRVDERTGELQRALENLRQLDRLKSEFITNVSHELRTPLQHLKGYIDLLADGAMGAVTGKQAEGLGMTQDAIERLESMVDDIVDFSSLNDESLALEPVYLADVCRNVIQGYTAEAARHKAAVTLAMAPDVPRVTADRVALTRVLRHLLDNAVKFGPANQIVQIHVERLGQRVRLSVRDHGSGLTSGELEHVFDAFYQVDGSSTRKAGGLGMGLALVRKLVEAHGSQVQVRSELGQGSTFWFELPVVVGEAGI
jgi:signal transduction histidine kinase